MEFHGQFNLYYGKEDLMEIIAPERLPRIAYFSMEIGLEAHIPTYSGGLGCSPAIPCAPPPTWGFPWQE